MPTKIKPCPFCGCKMTVVSNSDWHRLTGDHPESCMLNGWEDSMTMVPATPDQLEALISDWNTRIDQSPPAGRVVDALRKLRLAWLQSPESTLAEPFVEATSALKELDEFNGSLDARMRAAGMSTVAELLQGAPLDKFMSHAGVTDLKSLLQWSEMRRGELLRQLGNHDSGSRQIHPDLYEWVVAHAGAFYELHVNLRKALEGEHDNAEQPNKG